MSELSYLERRWEAGQRHLVAGRYITARRDLEAAEAAGWRSHDAASMRRVYLPLLEARRQIRQTAAEGMIAICDWANGVDGTLKEFLRQRAGTVVLACAGDPLGAWRFAGSVQYEARRTGRCLEALLLVAKGKEVRVATMADATLAGGLQVRWTEDVHAMIGASTEEELVVPLPGLGVYRPGEKLHAVARESLIVAWEALALKWQRRHPLAHDAAAWDEIAWLRLALRIDPACEPVTMRLMAVLETLEHAG